jgi:uncharacterized membrane protein
MKKTKNHIFLLTQIAVALFLMSLWAQPVNAQLGAGFITIDPPQSGFTTAYGINDHRKIVGTYYDAGGLGHGFLRNEDGRFVTIDHPDAQTVNGFGTEARGINSAGLIVGDYCAAPPCDGVSVIKGYLLKGDPERDEYDKDDFKTLETPGHINSYLQRVNSEGDIVGCEHDTDVTGTMHGILHDDGKVTSFPVSFSMNNGINKRGEIDGFYFDLTANRAHGYLLRKGVFTLIDFPDAVNTLAWDINNRGQIVGFYEKKGGSPTGYILKNGKFTSVVIPGALATFVYGMNSAGDIVGEYDDATTAHGFLLCNRDHADAEGCGEDAQGTTAAQRLTNKSPWVTLPENVRKLLLQRPGFGQFGARPVDRLER